MIFKKKKKKKKKKKIICRDFNLVQNQELDTYNYLNVNNPNAEENLLSIKQELNLTDPYREFHQDTKKFTWRKTNPIKQSRLEKSQPLDDIKTQKDGTMQVSRGLSIPSWHTTPLACQTYRCGPDSKFRPVVNELRHVMHKSYKNIQFIVVYA